MQAFVCYQFRFYTPNSRIYKFPAVEFSCGVSPHDSVDLSGGPSGGPNESNNAVRVPIEVICGILWAVWVPNGHKLLRTPTCHDRYDVQVLSSSATALCPICRSFIMMLPSRQIVIRPWGVRLLRSLFIYVNPVVFDRNATRIHLLWHVIRAIHFHELMMIFSSWFCVIYMKKSKGITEVAYTYVLSRSAIFTLHYDGTTDKGQAQVDTEWTRKCSFMFSLFMPTTPTPSWC